MIHMDIFLPIKFEIIMSDFFWQVTNILNIWWVFLKLLKDFILEYSVTYITNRKSLNFWESKFLRKQNRSSHYSYRSFYKKRKLVRTNKNDWNVNKMLFAYHTWKTNATSRKVNFLHKVTRGVFKILPNIYNKNVLRK